MVKNRFLSILFASTIMLGACSGEESHVVESEAQTSETHTSEEHSNHEHMSHDIREETSGADQLPEFLKDKPEDMQIIYAAAAKHQELLENMPCYCGCGESANHKNNYDCFIHENKENGAVVWDDHGTKCGVCLEIAAQSMSEFINGKSINEIRDMIDEQYKDGYAAPTPTPAI
ncbi:MAG TPA: PCYCGC motif-containing (lipo)protein [Chondromyces sp.]|nr:PCYCGC motif-containing (lipo)protein [Chondromyces sp.]